MYYSMLGAGARGWPTEMLWGGRWEGCSCLGTHVRIKDFKIKKLKIKKKKINKALKLYKSLNPLPNNSISFSTAYPFQKMTIKSNINVSEVRK